LRDDLSFNDIAKMINTRAGPAGRHETLTVDELLRQVRPSETARVLFHIDK
jgi:hypothetical protein